jgi:hypothetical protein
MPSTAEQRRDMAEASRELADELSYFEGVRRTGQRTWEAWSRTRAGLFNHRITVALDGAVLCTCEAGLNNLTCWAVGQVKQELAMTTETALVPVKVNPPARLIPTREERIDIKETAAMVVAGAVSLPEGITKPEQAAALMLYGWELGLSPMTSIQKLYMVKGHIAPSAEVMAGIAMRAEPDIRILIEKLTETECTLILERPSRNLKAGYSVTWSQIERAGLARDNRDGSPSTNKQYPEDRLRYHCMKRLLRAYCPDLINNLGSASVSESIAAPEDDDEVIDGEYRVNRSTGEIIDSTPSTDDQRATMKKLWPKASEPQRDECRRRWPKLFPDPKTPGGMNRINDTTEREAEAIIGVLATAAAESPAAEPPRADPPPAPTTPKAASHEHDIVFDPDKARMVCQVEGCTAWFDDDGKETVAPGAASPDQALLLPT